MSSKFLDIKSIMNFLPHRYPFLLVDRVLDYGVIDGSEYAEGVKNVTINEHFFQGHFSKEPIFPGVLIIEALAQISGIAILANMKTEIDNISMYFVKIDNAVFRAKVVPGDVLLLKSQKSRQKFGMYIFDATAIVEGKLVAQATLTATFANV